MIAFASFVATALMPGASPAGLVSRTAVRTNSLIMGIEETTRRELFTKLGAAVLGGVSLAQSASAKAGQSGKIGFFGMTDLSSPYQPGGPKAGPESTFGYSKSEGDFLANGYEADVSREAASFKESSKLISGLQGRIDAKSWWYVRDEMRLQAYEMRQSMQALKAVVADDKKAAADKAYKTFWSEVEQLDRACKKKEQELANKEFADVLAALDAFAQSVA